MISSLYGLYETSIVTSFLKYFTYAIELFINWSYKEEKEYYKKVCNNCLNSLIKCVKKIMEALENSNISLYKYM